MREGYVAPLVAVPLLMLAGYVIYTEITELKQRITQLESHVNNTVLSAEDGNIPKLSWWIDFHPY